MIFAVSGDGADFTQIHHMTAKPALFMPLSSWVLEFFVKLACPISAHRKSFFLPANHTHKMLLKRCDLAP
ncbi:MAG TPA: hypothetical protein DCG26_06280 [Alphaproteobacteria bacterium]|nr:hypothetical protein [Alphaproteobacteria bacterium]